jgi:PAS domain S-box-containing protein
MPSTKNQSERRLRAELKRVQARVAELEATINAIRSGDVDGIVVDGPLGSHIFTLQSPEEPYRILAERMNEGAATLTAEGTILFCNQRLAEMVERRAEQLPGSPFLSFLHEEEREYFPQLMQSALTRELRASGSLLRLDGSLLPVQLSLSPIPLGESAHGVCLVATDLTNQKRAQDEVHRLNAELEQQVTRRTAELQAVNQDLEAFSYAVAHDLRAPLRHIHGFSDLLQRDPGSVLTAEARHYVECIVDGSTRMAKLLEDLLNLSRFGRQAVHRQVTSLNELVRAVIDGLRPETASRRIEWKINELPPTNCDPALMKIVFVNLLSNAVKFTRPRTTAAIEVGQKSVKGEPVLFVRDNGAGFEMKYAGRLFGVFQRMHKEKDFEGTGIGLATVLRILQKHGGRIWAESAPDKGATFYFTCGDAAVSGDEQVAVGAKA